MEEMEGGFGCLCNEKQNFAALPRVPLELTNPPSLAMVILGV